MRGFAWLQGQPWATLCRRVAALSLLLHVLVAVRSEGFYHCDEHYQVIEFAASKAGITPVSALTWEYGAHIRPWFQPAFYYPLLRGCLALGISEPFTLALLLRLVTALLGWSALVAFARTLPHFFPDGSVRRSTLLALHFFHLVPMLSCRTSSENFAQIFLLFGLTLLIEPGRLGPSLYASPTVPIPARRLEPAWLLAGIAFGFSFLARYQAALFVAGVGLWFLVYGRHKQRFLLALSGGFLAAVAFGAVLDRWGYGAWVFPPWDYFRVNLIDGVAAKFSKSPPWGFVALFNAKLMPPFGMLWLLTLFAALFALPRHLLTWAVAPFVLGHHALAHKETRFLFPTLVLALVLAGLLVQRALDSAERRNYRAPRGVSAAVRGSVVLLFGLNLLGLVTYSLSPTSPRWTILQGLDALAPAGYTVFTGKGYDAITRCGSDPRFYWGKRHWQSYAASSGLAARDERGLPAFYAWTGNALTVHDNPFHTQCEELFPKFWLSGDQARAFWSKPLPSSLGKSITTYAVYRCAGGPPASR